MAKGQSFIGLTAYLEKCGKDEIKLSFSEVERILGFQLPDSAYLHQPYWSNSESRPIASGWLNAGYLSQHVDMKGQTVEFIKKNHQSRQIQGEAEKMAVISREKCAALALDEAVRCIRTYFNETVKDSHGRYMSWRHCYNAFVENRNDADEKMFDYLALHLAFYLASWGMYRGSSFLLQKDYKVHIPVVRILLEKNMILLWRYQRKDLPKMPIWICWKKWVKGSAEHMQQSSPRLKALPIMLRIP